MTRPFCTVTQTPHSILPQPRQQERMRLISEASASLVSLAASAVPAPKVPMAAVAAAQVADSFANVRRVMDNLPMRLSSSTSLCRVWGCSPAVRPSALTPSCAAHRDLQKALPLVSRAMKPSIYNLSTRRGKGIMRLARIGLKSHHAFHMTFKNYLFIALF